MRFKLVSTLSNEEYPRDTLREFSAENESLEVRLCDFRNVKIRSGRTLWERFADFIPFSNMSSSFSLGEGNTPLIDGGALSSYTGVDGLLLKNEFQNPTWSFKDRGSITCVLLAHELKERWTATISTGNMGNSIAAYGARAGLRVIVFAPHYAPYEKLMGMGVHGAHVLKVTADDYSEMKACILELAEPFRLRITTGNNAHRVEGYKLTAFELYEQLEGRVPDFIAVPTSACGHLRGIFKGYFELHEAGFIDRLPRMIVVQAKNNSPIVSAIKRNSKTVIPFTHFHTVAEAITTGNPKGGEEILDKAYRYGWLAEDVTEENILSAQQALAAAGLFVEPSSATTIHAVKSLRDSGRIRRSDRVVCMLTGAGVKDPDAVRSRPFKVKETDVSRVRNDMEELLEN